MAQSTIDYDTLAQAQGGASAGVDYDAIARKYGGVAVQSAVSAEPQPTTPPAAKPAPSLNMATVPGAVPGTPSPAQALRPKVDMQPVETPPTGLDAMAAARRGGTIPAYTSAPTTGPLNPLVGAATAVKGVGEMLTSGAVPPPASRGPAATLPTEPQRRQAMGATADIASGAMSATAPFVAPAGILNAPARAAVNFLVASGASAGAHELAKRAGLSPEAQELAGVLPYFLPYEEAIRLGIDPKIAVASSAEGTAVSAGIKGAKGAVAVTPTEIVLRGGILGNDGEIRIPRKPTPKGLEPPTIEGQQAEKPVIHASNDIEALRASAERQAPKVGDAVAAATEPVPGAKVEAVRDSKDTDRIADKAARQGVQPSQVGDISGAKISVPDQAAAAQVLQNLDKELPVQTAEGSVTGKPQNNAIRQVQAKVDTQAPPSEPVKQAEILLQTPEMERAGEATHDQYRKAQDLRAQGKEAEAAQIEQKIVDEHNAAEQAAQSRLEADNALRQPGPGSVLQHPQEETRAAGSKRGRVEPSQQGQEVAATRPEAAQEKPQLGVDFDDTLFKENPDGSIGQPIPERIASLKQRVAAGENVIVESHRVKDRPEEVGKIQDALESVGLPRLPVTAKKNAAPDLVDDTARKESGVTVQKVVPDANTPLPREPGQAPIPPGTRGGGEVEKPAVSAQPSKVPDLRAPKPVASAAKTPAVEKAVAAPKPVGVAEREVQPVEEKPFKYRSTQVNIPETSEAHTALETARQRISDADLAGKGKDVAPHVTVRYGLKDDQIDNVRKYLASLEPFEAQLGKTETFPPSESSDGAAVVHAPVVSPELEQINPKIGEHGNFTEPTFDRYAPHVTLAYVRPDRAARYAGMSITNGKTFKVDSIGITDREGNAEQVKLSGGAAKTASADSAVSKTGPDRVSTDTKDLTNVVVSPAFKEHGLGGLDVPTQRTVMSSVITALHDPKVRQIVMRAVPVNVVDTLAGLKSTAQVSFHDKDVLSDLLTGHLKNSVSIRLDVADSLARAVAGATAEVPRGASQVRGNTGNQLTTQAAGNLGGGGALKNVVAGHGAKESPGTALGDSAELLNKGGVTSGAVNVGSHSRTITESVKKSIANVSPNATPIDFKAEEVEEAPKGKSNVETTPAVVPVTAEGVKPVSQAQTGTRAPKPPEQGAKLREKAVAPKPPEVKETNKTPGEGHIPVRQEERSATEPSGSVPLSLEDAIVKLEKDRASDPVADLLLKRLDKAFDEKRGGVTEAQQSIRDYVAGKPTREAEVVRSEAYKPPEGGKLAVRPVMSSMWSQEKPSYSLMDMREGTKIGSVTRDWDEIVARADKENLRMGEAERDRLARIEKERVPGTEAYKKLQEQVAEKEAKVNPSEDQQTFRDGVMMENGRVGKNAHDYGRVVSGLVSVLESKGVKATLDHAYYKPSGKPLYWELTDLFHNPLASMNPKMPVETIARAMDGALPTTAPKIDERGWKFKNSFEMGHPSSSMEKDLERGGKFGQELETSENGAEKMRRKADIVQALLGETENVKKARTAADDLEKDADTLRERAEGAIATAKEGEEKTAHELKERPFTLAKQIQPIENATWTPKAAWVRNMVKTGEKTPWISDGHSAINLDLLPRKAANMAGERKFASSKVDKLVEQDPQNPGYVTAENMQKVLDAATKKSTSPGIVIGYLPKEALGEKARLPTAYIENSVSKRVISVNATLLRMVQDIVKPDSIKVGGTEGAVAFYKGDKLAAIILPLRKDEPDIDVPTAKKTVAAAQPAVSTGTPRAPKPPEKRTPATTPEGTFRHKEAFNEAKKQLGPDAKWGDLLELAAKIQAGKP